MKNLIKLSKFKFLPVLMILITMVNCSDFLDVEPKGIVSPTNVDQLGQLLIGNFNYRFSTRVTTMMPDEFTTSQGVYGIFSKINKNGYRWLPIYDEGDRDLDWGDLYEAIYNANYVLDLIDDAALDGESEARKANVKAEALTIRAFTYLQLVNIYGVHYNSSTSTSDLAVPLILSAQPIELPRSSVADIYTQIETDLLTAIDLFADNNLNSVRSESSKPGAMGILARMYLYQGDWNKALSYASETIDNYSSLYNYNDYTKETANEVKTGLADENIESVFFRMGSFGYASGSTIVTLTNELSDLFDSNDLRFDFFLDPDGDGNYIYNPVNPRIVIPLMGIQTPELYLIMAECNARLGNKNAAMDDLTILRENRFNRNAYSSDSAFQDAIRLSPSNNTEAIAFVIEERQREQMFSTLRWFDMKRLVVLGEYTPTLTRTVSGETYSLQIGSDQWVVDISPDIKAFNPLLN